MEKIRISHCSNKEWGAVYVEAKNNEDYYDKYGYFHGGSGCDVSIAKKDARYIQFMDHTGLIRSGNKYGVENLAHKRLVYGWPRGFDHTTQWRFKGDSYPLIVLTEPYDMPCEEILSKWNDYAERYGLKYLIKEPSKHSLWVPERTYMIWWWCPKYFDIFKDKKNIELSRCR